MNIKSFIKNITLLMVFSVAQTTFAADSDKYVVLNSWEEGVYTLRQECTNSLIKSVDDKKVDQSESRLIFTWQIDAQSEDAAGVQKFNMKMQRIMVKIRSNGKELLYFDSSNGKSTSKLLNAVFARMKSSVVTAVFKNGVPVEIQGCDNFWKDLPNPGDESEQVWFDSIKMLASTSNIKETFDTLTYLDSAKEVRVGDTWKNQVELPDSLTSLIGVKTLDWTCCLDSVNVVGGTPMANVSGKGQIEFTVKDNIEGNVRMEDEVVYNTSFFFPSDINSTAFITVSKTVKSEDEKHIEKYVGYTKNKLSVDKH